MVIYKNLWEMSHGGGDSMVGDPELDMKALAEQLWLAYFNDYLFEHGVISESDRNRMAIEIKHRKPINKKQVGIQKRECRENTPK